VISREHFDALLDCNDVYSRIVMRHVPIRIFLTNHYHSAKSISVDDECVWEKWRRSRTQCITQNPQTIANEQAFTFSCSWALIESGPEGVHTLSHTLTASHRLAHSTYSLSQISTPPTHVPPNIRAVAMALNKEHHCLLSHKLSFICIYSIKTYFRCRLISNTHIKRLTADTFIFVDYFIWSKSIHCVFWSNCRSFWLHSHQYSACT
jgi:hypothetical protein